nr:hypothetical protein [Tanacetum cinerariifolium]
MPKGPWESVSMDFITYLPKSKGSGSIIVVVDRFSKYGTFIATPPDVTADDMAKLFFKNVVKYWGVPHANILGPSGELDGAPTLPDGRDTTKIVEINLVGTQNLGGGVLHITREGFHLRTCVTDLITNGTCNWPQTWITKAPVLLQVPVPKKRDVIRPRGDVLLGHHIVWFSNCIPRHAFHLWSVMRNNLKTKDKQRKWDVGAPTDLNLLRCFLCDIPPDSHARLFSECPFSCYVWLCFRGLVGMDTVSPNLHDIIARLQPMARNWTARSIFGKLILAAASYFIWIERNNWLFKNSRRSPEEVIDIIMVTVRLKLITSRLKNTLW